MISGSSVGRERGNPVKGTRLAYFTLVGGKVVSKPLRNCCSL